ncbi:hypothetical protein NCU02411 [Neurospora crassa OR74A]|uniref:Microtubule associated protein n=1 Tax=Neurospora crassa (strain ATCC 24698 / 74-OR23-1A / CBS 708.71 / DSM 1257 / FGSC 987) TaxID=367110 RepID=Q7S473_NEUCR|nr:hypothetical protein NCU02411 [Neurospora crassa OR74A]EAA30303.1 hypothetical protein NCU02411 [Neurospora crassa OR74A]|eukprot:XP_959539.1 hypothetical protein NCU02411 [Neurospora crassa OR74A]
MVQPGVEGLGTPRTAVGDATFLDRQPDFDLSQELSFHSPSKDANIAQQLRNGNRPSLSTPRGTRAPFTNRRNVQANGNTNVGGPEFTPLLKSATRNSARRLPGKENGRTTPNFLERIDEDITPLPKLNTSVYSSHTPLPNDATVSSTEVTTPITIRRRGGTKGPLDDGNQLSLREQENVVNKIEKENFGLKLKIHFLEEALRKAGPGFSEAALKENTELKVDKVTMQRELQRYKKTLSTAEKDLEKYRAQMMEMQEKAAKKFSDGNQRAELDRLRQLVEEKEAEIRRLQQLLEQGQGENEKLEELQEHIEEEAEELREKAAEFEEQLKEAQVRIAELEDKAASSDVLREAQETIEDLQHDVRRLEQQLDDMKDKAEEAISQKDRAEADLQELQNEMANKSVITKGLSRQVEEKVARLQSELETARQECVTVAQQRDAQSAQVENLKSTLRQVQQERQSLEQTRASMAARLERGQAQLDQLSSEKQLLQERHDAMANESASLRREMSGLQTAVSALELNMERERQNALNIEQNIRAQYKDEMDRLNNHALSVEQNLRAQYAEEMKRLNNEISDLQAECREKDNLYDNDSEKWEAERRKLEAELNRAQERASGLQVSLDQLRQTEGNLSNKEARLQHALQLENERHKREEALLSRQIQELQQNLQSRQAMLEDLRKEMRQVQDQHRQTQLDYQAQTDKIAALEDEVEVLQAALDEESERAGQDLEKLQEECMDLKQKLASAQATSSAARASMNTSNSNAPTYNESQASLRIQLADANENLARIMKEQKMLQERYNNLDAEARSLRINLSHATAERDELEAELQQHRDQGPDQDTFQLDQEKLNLRSAKTRLDNEIRRLREENRSLLERQRSMQKSLEEEIEKASAEEERLNQEILQLQAKVRDSSSSAPGELVTARRTIRELERRIAEFETQQATSSLFPNLGGAEGNHEISLLQRDLTAARKKEIELLQREAAQKETIKLLKRQIADLERRVHEATISKLAVSPLSSHGGDSAQKNEISELRQQLTTAHQSIYDLKTALREAERKVSTSADELQRQYEDLEDEKMELEQLLDEAQIAAEEAQRAHEQALKKYKQRSEKYKSERDGLVAASLEDQKRRANKLGKHHPADLDNSLSSDVSMSLGERRDLHNMLKESQLAADKLDREVREYREALEEMMAIEVALRKKLERARSERAAYRASAEKLHRDVKTLTYEKERAVREAKVVVNEAVKEIAKAKGHDPKALVYTPKAKIADGTFDTDTEAIIRAAEAAERRHEKEIRGLVMQMEWMKACWDREARLRKDAAFAKRYLTLEVQIRDACNKADLAIINRIRAELGANNNPSSRKALGQLSSIKKTQQQHGLLTPPASSKKQQPRPRPGKLLKMALTAVRFVVRMRIEAKKFAENDKVRQRLADCVEQMEREDRIRQMRDQWRAKRAGPLGSSSGGEGDGKGGGHHGHGYDHDHDIIGKGKGKQKSSGGSSKRDLLMMRGAAI